MNQSTSIVSSITRACAVMLFGPLLACGAQQSGAKTGDTAPAKPAESAHAAEAPSSGRPIMDTHIHLWTVTRPGGVAWPSPKHKLIYRDITPAEYEAVAKKNGIIGTGIVEASPKVDDNDKILDLVKGNDFFKFLVGQLEIGSPDFSKDLNRLAKDPRFVGIRGFLWSPKLTLDAKQIASCKELAAKGLSLDIISRGDLNPKDKILQLTEQVPKLRIIIDHLGGAKGETPDPKWMDAMQKLAKHKNVYIKFSSFFDMFNPSPTGSEEEPWQGPTTVSSYKAHFDFLMKTFGDDHLIWGSNWPVVTMGGGIEKEIAIAEEYLKSYGTDVRDKVMYKNAQAFYQQKKPD